MPWPLVDNLDLACLAAFGTQVLVQPQASPSYSVTMIPVTPAMEEELLPGNTAVLRLFVRFADLPQPILAGDQVTLSGTLYNIFDVKVDVEGGAVLKLRRA